MLEQAIADFAAAWTTIELESVGSLLSPRLDESFSSVSFGGSSIEITDLKKQLLVSATRGDLARVVGLLATEKVSLNTRDGDGNTALILAIQYGHVEVAMAIVSSGKANINIVNDAGETALMIAAGKGYFPLIKKMLRVAYVMPGIVNNKNQTASMIALEHGYEHIAAFLDASSEYPLTLKRG